MDVRITNTCNNNCLYCLEQPYRNKDKFINKNFIFDKILENKIKDNITFYGGNPILHPDILEIISFSKNIGYPGIGILTNTGGIDNRYLDGVIKEGLTSIGFYFNSFDMGVHNLIVNGGIEYEDLINNISLIKKSGIFYKAIIHINKQNIKTAYRDIYILNKKYGVKNMEFINYFPFDRPYENFRNLLEYSYPDNRNHINNLFKVILKEEISTNFYKFDKLFFGDYIDFYDYNSGILSQIGEEDILRLSPKTPFCLKENRCTSCFIKDNCILYN